MWLRIVHSGDVLVWRYAILLVHARKEMLQPKQTPSEPQNVVYL